MIYTTETRNFFLSPGVNCTVEVPVPDLRADPYQAPGLGKSHSEKSENLDRFLSEIFFPQYTRAIKNSNACYISAGLPEKFLCGVNVSVESLPVLITGVHGFYNHNDDIIVINADTLVIGCRSASGEFVYGHEVGHRIVYKKNAAESEAAISDVCSIMMISDRKCALEMLCDAFGELIASNSRRSSAFRQLVAYEKIEGLKKTALKLAWSC